MICEFVTIFSKENDIGPTVSAIPLKVSLPLKGRYTTINPSKMKEKNENSLKHDTIAAIAKTSTKQVTDSNGMTYLPAVTFASVNLKGVR